MSLLKSQAYIDGEWVDAVDGTTFDVKNPANGETLGTVPNMAAVDVEIAIATANRAFKTWGATTGKERSILLKKWYDLIKENAKELVKILATEAGNSLWEAKRELNIALGDVEFFAEEAKKVDDWIPNQVYVERQPLGVIGLIMPWNFPLALSVKKMATALAAGCTCVLKPSEDTPLAVLAAVELAQQADFPKGVINVITSDCSNASAVGKVLCSSPLIAGISFTGSTQVGEILYEQCAPHIKKLPLELGVNIPFLVFNSANIDKIVNYGMSSTFWNCGEIPAASYVFLVQEDAYDQFVQEFSEAMNIETRVSMGPTINKTQFERLRSMVDDAKSKGANVLVNRWRTIIPGELFYAPTLITDVTNDMQVFRDEAIKAVVSVMKFKSEEEGVALANDTKTKLAAYFFTEDLDQLSQIRKLLQAPKIKINEVLTSGKDHEFLRRIKTYDIDKKNTFYGIDEYCRFFRPSYPLTPCEFETVRDLESIQSLLRFRRVQKYYFKGRTMSLLKSQAYINGEWVDAVDETTYDVKNPVDGETVVAVPNMDGIDVEIAIAAANQAFKTWGATTGKERSILLMKWYDLIKKNGEKLMKILARETGNSQCDAKMELNIALGDVEFSTEEAKKVDDWIPNQVYVKRQPLGVIGLIMPWNFPLVLSVKKMGTVLAAGCTCVLKPSEDAPLAVLAVVELAHQAGFPKGVINVITSDRPNASAVDKALCSSPLIAGISFTSSTQVGKILYEQCAPHIKILPLDLGRNIPFLVFNSANIDKIVKYGISSTFWNCGEIRPAFYVFLVQEGAYDQFIQKFSEAMNMQAGVRIGPVINKTQFQRLCSMVDDAKSKGANVLVNRWRTIIPGELFYAPTLITDVTNDMQVFRDEAVKAVVSVMKFKSEEEGVILANDTKTKLAVYFFTEDLGQLCKIRKLLQAPKIKINDFLTSGKDHELLCRIKTYDIDKKYTFYGVDEYCSFFR